MGKTFDSFSAILPPTPPVNDVQKAYNGVRSIAAVNSLPTTQGPAQPLPSSLTMPSSFGDATKRLQDAFTAFQVMNATRKGDGKTALDALNGR